LSGRPSVIQAFIDFTYLLTYLLTRGIMRQDRVNIFVFLLIVVQRADYTLHFMDVTKEGTIFFDDRQ